MIDLIKRKVQSWISKRGIRIERLPNELSKNQDCILHQNFDFIIAHHLIQKDRSSDFSFLQIGAFDGVSGDPIYPYVQKYGWKGILVEPQEYYFSKLKENYNGSDGLKFLNVAISSERGKKTLYTLEEPAAPELPNWAPQIASFSRENVLKHQDKMPDLENRIREETVDCITFDDLVARSDLQSLDLIQIDVEGYDYEILRLIEFHKLRPNIVRFEHKHLSKKDQNSAIRLLVEANYKIVREPRDTIGYLAKEEFV